MLIIYKVDFIFCMFLYLIWMDKESTIAKALKIKFIPVSVKAIRFRKYISPYSSLYSIIYFFPNLWYIKHHMTSRTKFPKSHSIIQLYLTCFFFLYFWMWTKIKKPDVKVTLSDFPKNVVKLMNSIILKQ